MTKYIFVTGGVISGLGKGVISASIGAILQMLGEKKITIKKLDPYLNVDAGTMNPMEHGEVFVTNDGTETDLDLGYYERFLNIIMTERNSTSSGKLFQKLLTNERNGSYLGKTIQMIPHFTNMIKEFICDDSSNYDYIICEIGGSVGDIEAMAFYEALRQLKSELGNTNILYLHLTYLIYLSLTKEIKTKPTQNTIKDLQQFGITPDILICRSEVKIPQSIKEKLSLYTNVSSSNIIEVMDLSSIYQVPINLIKQNIHIILKQKFNIHPPLKINKWQSLNERIESLQKSITIGILGKYTELNDSYKSLLEAIFHAGIYHNHKINIHWINSRDDKVKLIDTLNGIIIPGGFGLTGIETMISLIHLIRTKKIPTFGICLGMQLMIIEYCRNVLHLNAGSEEFDNQKIKVIKKIKEIKNYGGSMRLGKSKIKIIKMKNSKLFNIYNSETIYERHRHRYTVNNDYLNLLNQYHFQIVASSYETNFIETVELNNDLHDWYIGCQYHPEYQSSPFKPHPLFLSFIQYSIFNKK